MERLLTAAERRGVQPIPLPRWWMPAPSAALSGGTVLGCVQRLFDSGDDQRKAVGRHSPGANGIEVVIFARTENCLCGAMSHHQWRAGARPRVWPKI